MHGTTPPEDAHSELAKKAEGPPKQKQTRVESDGDRIHLARHDCREDPREEKRGEARVLDGNEKHIAGISDARAAEHKDV
eukprot:6449492-Pyramimonas_sp.AAC.1